MEYTVIGDAVNLASRICGATPGGKTWISEQTYEQVKGEISATVIGPQVFKGKEKPVTIYQVEG
jgi:adenylate cyclase